MVNSVSNGCNTIGAYVRKITVSKDPQQRTNYAQSEEANPVQAEVCL